MKNLTKKKYQWTGNPRSCGFVTINSKRKGYVLPRTLDENTDEFEYAILSDSISKKKKVFNVYISFTFILPLNNTKIWMYKFFFCHII